MSRRVFVRDWRGRFAEKPSSRVKKVKHVRKPVRPKQRGNVAAKLARSRPASRVVEAKRLAPPTWDKIKGDNARDDGLKLWTRKQLGEFPSNVEFYKAADGYHREWRKKHPGVANYASKNMIANAAYRHELEETGKVEYLAWPGEKPETYVGEGKTDKTPTPKKAPAKRATPKSAPAKPTPKASVGRTKKGIEVVAKPPKPKAKSQEEQDAEDEENIEVKQDHEFLAGTYGKDETKKQTGSVVRKQLREATAVMVAHYNTLDFDNGTISDKDKKKFRELGDEVSRLTRKLEHVKPDRTRKISEAKDYTELREIMEDRHPTLEVQDFGKSVAEARKKMIDGYVDRGIDRYRAEGIIGSESGSFNSTLHAFYGLDRMMVKYPKVDIAIWGAKPYAGKEDNFQVGAYCERGGLLQIHINPMQLANWRSVQMHSKEQAQRGDTWHAKNHYDKVFQNNIIHEFGHAYDWRAQVWPAEATLDNITASDMIKTNTNSRAKDISLILVDEYTKAHGDAPNSVDDVHNWLWDNNLVTGYSWEQNAVDWAAPGKPKAIRKLFHDELIAEAFTDVEINGSEATVVNKAIVKKMKENFGSKRIVGNDK